MKGYHVLCVGDAGTEVCEGKGAGDASCENTEGKVPVTICWNGRRNDCEKVHLTQPGNKEYLKLEEELVSLRPLANPKRYERLKKAYSKKDKWSGLFSFYQVPSNEVAPVTLRSAGKFSGLILAFEGGVFLWPGIEIGFTRNVTIQPTGPNDKAITLELLTQHVQPLVVEVSSFLDAAECNHIIEKATPHVIKSVVSHMDHDVGKPSSDWRTSSTYFMQSDDDLLRRLDRRVAALTRLKTNHQEYSQILRYGEGEKYAAHHDFFDPDNYKSSKEIQSLTKKGLFNRLATVFFYLSTVEAGGETNFPRAGGLDQPSNFEKCDTGISISPREGRIIIFYSQDAAGRLDDHSLHGGCAVKKGVKWSANKWIWNKPMGYTP